ncbi:unnamed protein product [Closterium sp. NIES-65]|nr:unnamed protein product [Closterium sp. NIES-65]
MSTHVLHACTRSIRLLPVPWPTSKRSFALVYPSLSSCRLQDSIFSSFAEERPGVVLVFLGKEVSHPPVLTSALAAFFPLSLLAPLLSSPSFLYWLCSLVYSSPAFRLSSPSSSPFALLSQSASSKVFPYVQPLDHADTAHALDALLASFSSLAYAGHAAVSASCGPVSRPGTHRFSGEDSLQDLLNNRASVRASRELDMVLYCSDGPASADSHDDAVAAETIELFTLTSLIQCIAPNYTRFCTTLPLAALPHIALPHTALPHTAGLFVSPQFFSCSHSLTLHCSACLPIDLPSDFPSDSTFDFPSQPLIFLLWQPSSRLSPPATPASTADSLTPHSFCLSPLCFPLSSPLAATELSNLVSHIKAITPNYALFYTALPDADVGAQRRLLAAADDYPAAGTGAADAAAAGGGEGVGAGADAGAGAEGVEGQKVVKAAVAKNKCGPTCKTRTALLEGIFAGIVMLMILVSGLTVLSQIDTPTRFEVSREAS